MYLFNIVVFSITTLLENTQFHFPEHYMLRKKELKILHTKVCSLSCLSSQAINKRTEACFRYEGNKCLRLVAPRESGRLSVSAAAFHPKKGVGGEFCVKSVFEKEETPFFLLGGAPRSRAALGADEAWRSVQWLAKKKKTRDEGRMESGKERRTGWRPSPLEGFLSRRSGGEEGGLWKVFWVFSLGGRGEGGMLGWRDSSVWNDRLRALPPALIAARLSLKMRFSAAPEQLGTPGQSLIRSCSFTCYSSSWDVKASPLPPPPPPSFSGSPSLRPAETESGVWDQAAVLGGAAGPPPAAARQLERGAVGQAQHGQPGGAC